MPSTVTTIYTGREANTAESITYEVILPNQEKASLLLEEPQILTKSRKVQQSIWRVADTSGSRWSVTAIRSFSTKRYVDVTIQAESDESLKERKIDYIVERASYRAESTREELVSKARRLADDLNTFAGRLEANHDYVLNSLGEVQGKGMDIDRLCAILTEQRSLLQTLKFIEE